MYCVLSCGWGRLTAGGTRDRVSLGNGTAEGDLRDKTVNRFAYVRQGMEHDQCSVYATEVSSSIIYGCMPLTLPGD